MIRRTPCAIAVDRPPTRSRDLAWTAPRVPTWRGTSASNLVRLGFVIAATTLMMSAPVLGEDPPRRIPNPAARLLTGSKAHEAWTLYLDLESGHRITQRFLLTNMGPGEHTAVALGHLIEPGRVPYRYVNGRRRGRWTLSEDRLFFDIAASHLDLHRPRGELRITKDDIELRFFFEFAAETPSASLPVSRGPSDYRVEVLAIGTETAGTIRAPWMDAPLETHGHAWLVHTWSEQSEASLLERRIDFFAHEEGVALFALQLSSPDGGTWDWVVHTSPPGEIVESHSSQVTRWQEKISTEKPKAHPAYPLPLAFDVSGEETPTPESPGDSIFLGPEWLRFDPLEVIPQPFRWFIRRTSQPREVWAEAKIGGSLFRTPGPPPLPNSGEKQQALSDRKISESTRGARETEALTAGQSTMGVACITFFNPVGGR